jgi:hypothetical protein
LETRLTQDGEEDVDEEIGAATTLEEDTHGREDDGKDDLADIAVEMLAFVFVGYYLVRDDSINPS